MKNTHQILPTLLFIVGIFLFSNNKISAQPNQFFPTKDAMWEEAFIGIAGVPIPTYFAICGDTMIDNTLYAKLYTLQVDNMGNVTNKIYEGGVKPGADQVWLVKPGQINQIVLYDFALLPGEEITVETISGSQNTLTVEHNELINTNDGITRRVIYFFSQGVGIPQEYWIEGIGSSRGLLTRGMELAIDFEPYMNCYKYEDQLTWSNPVIQPECTFSYSENCETTPTSPIDFLKEIQWTISPNPFAHETEIKIDGFENLEEPIVRIFDLQGKLIEKIDQIGEEKLIFSRKHLNAGLYVFELRDLKTTFAVRKKIIIQ